MLKHIVAATILSLSSSLMVASANPQNGIYLDKYQGFSVAVPFSLSVNNTHKYIFYQARPTINGNVKFDPNTGHWLKGGEYSVVWLNCNKKVCLSEQEFKKIAPQAAQKVLNRTNHMQNHAMNFNFVSGKMISVTGKPAYQFIAQGTIQGYPAVWLETDVYFKKAVGIASLIQQIDPNKKIDSQINWKMYNQFLSSLKAI